MALTFEDVKDVLTGGASSATTSPLAAMRANAKVTAQLLAEETSSNKKLLRLTAEIRDSLKSIRSGGNGGLGLGDIIAGGFIKDALTKLRAGRGNLARRVGQTMSRYGRSLGQFAAKAADIVFTGTLTAVRAAGAPVMKMLRGIASSTIRTVVAGATKSFKWIGTLTSTMMGALKGAASMGGGLAKFMSKIPNLSVIGRIGGGLLKKVFWPVQAVFSIFDAVSGWKDADKILGKPATIKGKIISSIGSVLNGVSFGLTDKLAEWFGGENLARVINNSMDSAGAKIYDMFNNMWNAIPSWDTIKENMPDITGLVTNFVYKPGQLLKDAVNYAIENIPDVTTLATDLGNTIWESITGLFDGIKNKVKSGIDGVTNWWSTGNDPNMPPPAMDPETRRRLDQLNALKTTPGLIRSKLVYAGIGPVGGGQAAAAAAASGAVPTPAPDAVIAPTATVPVAPIGTPSNVTPWAFTEEGSKFWINAISDGVRKGLSTTPVQVQSADDNFIGKNLISNDGGNTVVQPMMTTTPKPVEEAGKSVMGRIAAALGLDNPAGGGGRGRPAGSPLSGQALLNDFLGNGGGNAAANGGQTHREVSGGSTYDTANITPSGYSAAGHSARADIINAMMEQGLSRREASAITGNMYTESKFNPNARGDNGSAYGLMQWRHGRRANLMRFASERGLDPADRKTQAMFAVEETKSDSPYADYGSVAARKWWADNPNASLSDMTGQFMKLSERPNSDPRINKIGERVAAAEAAHSAPNNIPGSALPGTAPGDERFKVVGNADARGIHKVDPRLVDILRETSKYLPDGHRMELFSGMRPGDSRNHGKGIASDVRIIGPDGKELGNYQDPANFRAYEKMAQNARAVQMQKYPELAKLFRWGGYFSGGKKNPFSGYGGNDAMHFDIGGQGMAAGSWENGLNPRFRGKFDTAANPSVGMGNLADYQLPTIGKNLLADRNAINVPAPNMPVPGMNPLRAAALTRDAVQGSQSGFLLGLRGSNSLNASPVSAGVDTFRNSPPPMGPVVQSQPAPVPPGPTQEKAEVLGINSVRTMDELDTMLWNTPTNG